MFTAGSDKLDWSKSFMYSLHETYFLVEKKLEQTLLENKGITFSQFLILLPLNCKGQASQTEIAEYLHMTEPTISRHVHSLAKGGYLNQRQDPKSRRRHVLTLTPKGKREFAKAHKLIVRSLKNTFDTIPKSERQHIIRAFDRVLKKLLTK